MQKNYLLKDFKRDDYLFLILLVLIIFIPIYPKFPLFAVKGTYVSIRLDDIVISLGMGIWFLSKIKLLPKIFKSVIFQVFALFWLIGIVSLLAGSFITHTVQFKLGLLHFLRRIELMGLFFMAATMVKRRYQLKAILVSVLISSLFIVIYGIGQVYLHFPVVSTTNREFSKGLILSLTPGARPNSTFAGHYDLAAYLSVILVFLASFFFFFKSKLTKIIMAIEGVLGFALLGMTAARMSFVASLVGLTMAFWLIRKRWLIIALIVVSSLAVVAIPSLRHRLVATVTVNIYGGGGAKYTPPPDAVNDFTPQAQDSSNEVIPPDRIKDATQSAVATASASQNVASDIAAGEPTDFTELEVSRSVKIRTDVEWPRAIRAFGKNPLLGTGYSSITIATDNDLLRSLGETGLLGTLSLALIFFICLKRFILKLSKTEGLEKMFLIGAICSTVGLLITGLFIDVLEASKIASILWIILGVSWAISSRYDEI